MQTVKTSQYDWSSHANRDINYQYTIIVKNKFDSLQKTRERHTPNDEYENFVTTHIEAAVRCIPIKPRTKC